MDKLNFYISAMSLLLYANYKLTFATSIDSEKGFRKILLHSSNNETFSFTSLTSLNHDQQEDVNTNETWRATDFHLRNITTLISEYPLISHSLPTKNFSRFFCSKRSPASLTIFLPSFKHGVMFLNFSYFIGKTEASASQLPLAEKNDDISDQKLNDLSKFVETRREDTVIANNINSTQSTTVVPVLTNASLSNSKVSNLNQSSVSISISVPLKEKEVSVTGPVSIIKPEVHRKRRSIILESILRTTSPSVLPPVDDVSSTNSPNEIKDFKELMTSETTDSTTDTIGNATIPTTSVASSNNVNLTNTIDSLTLVQAVEMIKTAAVAISKGTVASPAVPISNNVVNTSGPKDDLSYSLNSTGNKVEASNELQLKSSDVDINTSDIEETTTEIEMTHHNHHKLKNGSTKNSKSENKKRKNRGKKVDSAERSEKDEESDDISDNDRDSNVDTSSSSEEEEIEENEYTERKPRISYKMWRASLEKKNRPPGFYLTVNDDIVFDNWEGIWDKQFVLGRWTGSKALVDGKWNRTSLFMNWDSLTTGRDLKITFEWEPIDEEYELILSDIDISTMISAGSSDEAHTVSSKEKIDNDKLVGQLETQGKISFNQGTANEAENQSSIIVLKQSTNVKEGWELVTGGRTETSTWGKIENLDLHQLPENNKVKLGKKETKPDEILQAILERLQFQDNVHNEGTAQQNVTSKSTAASTSLSLNEETLSTDQTLIHDNRTSTSETNSSNISTRIIVETSTRETADFTLSLPTFVSSPTTQLAYSTASTSSSNGSSTVKTLSNSSNIPLSTTIAEVTTTPTPSKTTDTPITPVFTSTGSTSINVPAAVQLKLNITSESVIIKSVTKALPVRKTDGETALVVSVFTGGVALVILVMIVKKRIDISTKGQNATR